MTMESDHDELERLNKESNERMAKRPVTNLMRCTHCRGSGKIEEGDVFIYGKTVNCHICKGAGHVNNTA